MVLLLGAVSCNGVATSFDYRTLTDPTRQPYKVQSGDMIHVRVLRNENTSGQYAVRPDGKISLPLAGEVEVRGMTMSDVRDRLVHQLKRFIDDAASVVSVSLSRVHGVSYSVIGEVTRAGVFQSTRYVTILEALAQAGGLTPYAGGSRIHVIRRAADGQQLNIPAPYKSLIQDPTENRNFYLLNGDIVVVP